VRPLRRSDVASRRLGEECLLYDDERESIHVLNRVAEFIWQLCDGSHTPQEMEQKTRAAFDVPEGAPLSAEIASILGEFERLGVLEAGSTSSDG
jgi:hypothetical protein